MLDDSSFELCRWFITEAIPQSSTSLLVALSVWRLCVHPKLWNYVSHWSCHIIQMSRLLSWELVACWAAGRRPQGRSAAPNVLQSFKRCLRWQRWAARATLSWSRQPHTSLLFTADERRMTVSRASTSPSCRTSVREGGRWVGSFLHEVVCNFWSLIVIQKPSTSLRLIHSPFFGGKEWGEFGSCRLL